MSSIETAIHARLKRIDSGNYERNSKLVLNDFADFVSDRGVRELEDVTETDCRRYAQELADRVEADELAASSANTYYDIVRAWFGWCVRDGRIPENPAEKLLATEDLPQDTGSGEQQYWPPQARARLLAHMDMVADEAHDLEDDRVRFTAHRDRALVFLLAYSGARGAEVVRDPDDDKRDGVRWRDVDLDAGVMTVLGKDREDNSVPILQPAVERLERYKRLVEPLDSWPVFATFHPPNLYRRVRAEADGDVEAALEADGPIAVMRDRGIDPKAISVQSTRDVMQRRCEEANVTDDDGEYLKPHGGRRALGDELYEESAELAQEVLRHKNIGTTHDAYRDVKTAQRKEAAEDVLFGGEDGE